MKRFIYHMVLVCVLFNACTETITEVVDPYSSGDCIGKIELGALAGSLSISVETEGEWRLETEQEWLRTDTKGRSGNGAFTVYYDSNESDVMTLKEGRVGKLAIRLAGSMKIDTLVFVQQGFYPVEADFKVVEDKDILLEYNVNQTADIVLLCCSSEGTCDIQSWIESQNADVVILDGEVTGEVEGLNVRGCNYAGLTCEEEYNAFRNLIQQTYNAGPNAGDDWIYAGQMYHLSAMQFGYDATPEWYPTTKEAEEFQSDRYAWQNNLYDCVWMHQRDYVTTYTDADGRSYTADYVYASSSAFSKVTSVQLLDVDGLSHKVIKLTLKY